MGAGDVWDDARRLAEAFAPRPATGEPDSPHRIPLPALLAALDDLNHEELVMLQQRLQQRLAV